MAAAGMGRDPLSRWCVCGDGARGVSTGPLGAGVDRHLDGLLRGRVARRAGPTRARGDGVLESADDDRPGDGGAPRSRAPRARVCAPGEQERERGGPSRGGPGGRAPMAARGLAGERGRGGRRRTHADAPVGWARDGGAAAGDPDALSGDAPEPRRGGGPAGQPAPGPGVVRHGGRRHARDHEHLWPGEDR